MSARNAADFTPASVPQTSRAMVVRGMPELLESLSTRDDVQLSLVTGNFEAVARVKLKAGGLGHWFARGPGRLRLRLGGPHDAAPDRASARRRGGGTRDLLAAGADARDRRHATGHRLRARRRPACVAVTTGPHSREELVGADVIVESTAELLEAIDALSVSMSD